MDVIRVRNKGSDPKADSLKDRISDWLEISIENLDLTDVYLLNFDLSDEEIEKIKEELVIDPVTQEDFGVENSNCDWVIQIGLKPGMKDNEGERTTEAIEELLERDVDGNVYTSTEYYLKGNLEEEDVRKITDELLANELIHRVEILKGSKIVEEKEKLNKVPNVNIPSGGKVKEFDLNRSVEELLNISKNRNLALSEDDMSVIKNQFQNEEFIEKRKSLGLSSKIMDVELEALAQTQSEHCKHKIFNGKITYRNYETNQTEQINSLFKTYIKNSTEEIDPEWILSVFWDNAGIIEFNDDYGISMKYETHNSPSGKEPYGGSITGIVGVYRDPMGTGKGSRIIAGSYGFCTPDPFYDGNLDPELHPRRLLEGIVDGVRDGGNKSGIPTIFGYSKYDNCFLGKPLVYVGALGLMPKEINGEKSWKKDVKEGDFIVTVGGRVGRDGIHGVTEASLEFGEHITAGHVQIGDPFTQKKVHDFLMEARDSGLYKLIWDCGGGGISSAIGETAQFSDGCVVDLNDVPLKYQGLNPWEIWISESQERMILGVDQNTFDELKDLAQKHDVEIAKIGKFKENGNLHLRWKGKTVAYLPMDFLHKGFPKLKLKAEWKPKEREEPEINVKDHNKILLKILQRPNIASREWIQRQYDHEVQGTSVIKPLLGKDNDVDSDASVIKPIHDSPKGLALSLGNCFKYSQIDPYWMAACSLDEAIRRVISVGASLDRIALNDNFCWPNSIYDPETNPEGKKNLGALVRANKALYRFTKAFETPCISGKDSMYIDGNLKNDEGEEVKVSGHPALQFAALGRVDDVEKCINLTLKNKGDLIYLIGETRDELGASEFYEMNNEVGSNVPKVDERKALRNYRIVEKLIDEETLNSCHGIYRGGLAVALAKKAFAGKKGLEVDLNEVSSDLRNNWKILYSESPSRFLITVSPEEKKRLEEYLDKRDVSWGQIGTVREKYDNLRINGINGVQIVNKPVEELKEKWKSTFKDF